MQFRSIYPARPFFRAIYPLLRAIGRRAGLIIVLLLFVLYGLHWLPGWRHQMNPDGVAYLSIAQKYLNGHFGAAVSGYWSPLYSWLMIPFLAMGIAPLLVTKMVALCIGGGIILIVWRLMGNLGLPRDNRFFVGLALIPSLIWFGYMETTPDLLLAGMILLYLMYMVNPRYDRRWWSGAGAGFLGGLMYLTKAYALPFMLAHFTLIHIAALLCRRREDDPSGAEIWKNRRRHVFSFISGMVVLGIIAGAWSGILTHKFGHFMTGSTGEFNWALSGPGSPGYPMHTDGFLPPSDPYAVSVWDDITEYQPKSWSPFENGRTREYLRQILNRNSAKFLEIAQRFTWLFYPIVIAAVLLAASGVDPRPRRPVWILLSAMVIYPCGYFLLHTEQRFFEPVCFLLLILGAFAIGAAVKTKFWAGWGRGWLLLIVLGISFLYNPIAGLDRGWGRDVEVQKMADILAGRMKPGSKMAGNGDWGITLYLAYDLKLKYYGHDTRSRGRTMEANLKKYGVDYFFCWGGDYRYPFVRNLPEITHGDIPGLRIYHLTADAPDQNG